MNNRFVQAMFRKPVLSTTQFLMPKLAKSMLLGAITLALSIPTQAEQRSYTCHYTEASYTAPFTSSPSIRQCPEGECAYHVQIGNNSAAINGISGFSVVASDNIITLRRSVKDPVMGGLDTTEFVLDTSNLEFMNTKTTTPAVTLTTKGSCL